jgi:beta-galactosidase
MQDAVLLAVAARMMGEWPCPIPRFGLRFDLPRVVDRVRWFGRGPGESYRDTGYAARVGRFERTVDEMQTPYVRPQENGHRSDVRWAELTDPTGTGIRIDGAPSFGLTVRRWTSEQLDRAMHTDELTDEGAVFLTVDAAQHGIGSASCGPGVLPQHQLWGVPATFSCLLQPVPSAVFTADQSPGSAGS